jgi:DNA-binding transcriptional LysR family regulator
MADWTGASSDLDLRKLRYFLAVADTLNFGRAAALLHIAQPVLTRQIRALEVQLGAQLFERSSRGTRLTPVGVELVGDARRLLHSARRLQQQARRSGRSDVRLAIGFMPGLVTSPLIRALHGRFPDLDVDVLRTGWDDQVEVLHDGRVDLSLVRLPVPRRGLAILPVVSEPRVAMLSVDHRLAHADHVTLDDLAGIPLLQDPSAVPELRGSRAAEAARPQATVEEKLERVAIEQGLVVLPQSTARYYTRPDVIARAIPGLAPTEVGLARLRGAASPVITAAEDLVRGSALAAALVGREGERKRLGSAISPAAA